MKKSIFPSRAKFSGIFNLNRIAGALTCLCFLTLAGAQAQSADSADGVTVKGDRVYCLRGDRTELLTDNVKFPFDVEVTTNGTFTVANGRERRLQPGQVLRRDGWLLDADGSIQPVFDHVAMKGGQVIVVRDGQTGSLTEQKNFPNHMIIAPDGTCVSTDGRRARLVDGQAFRMDGTVIPAKDTATLINGRVVVQKDGSLSPLSPVQIMGMSDGTRVRGDGTITKRDGSTSQLREGRTVLIEGVIVGR